MRCVLDWQCDQVSGGCHFLAMVSVINHDHSLGVLPEHQGVTALFVSVRVPVSPLSPNALGFGNRSGFIKLNKNSA
ncbi:MAG: hypothetical protein P1U77_19475, partial [Rubripirellula sp.]|nr:hypothetical protein [Rubripirellula sp.]